jgi:hypothetical protein
MPQKVPNILEKKIRTYISEGADFVDQSQPRDMAKV